VRIVLKLMVTKSGVIGLSIGLIVVFTAISLAGNDKILDETSDNSKDESYDLLSQSEIPENCTVWFDGCNTCMINLENPEIMGCTKMACFEYEQPMCIEFSIP
jgi:hypothetical protein